MQKEFKKGLLKILKSHRNLQKPALKANENDLKNFKSDLKPPKSPSESFEDASEEEIEFKTSDEDLDENQLETE